ncbi:MAG TPA: ABC transporter permease [Candidatus Binatia bacterium]|jgi:ABC-type dipeptide/oligopeptide/nickel transport system permease component
MRRLILGRLAIVVPTLLAAASLVFALLHLVPGDPVEMMIGENAQPAARSELRSRLGLDLPIPEQYATWITNAARGNLGTSIRSGRPVAAIVCDRVGATVALALAACAVAIIAGVALGSLAATMYGSRVDRAALLASTALWVTPSFWLGPMLVLVLSVALGLLPVAGSGDAAHLVLPALTLGAAMSGVLARMTRASLLEAFSDDFVRTARAKGASPLRVLLVHALPNAATPLVSVIGLQFGAVLAGSVVTETIFAWPGLGRLVVEAIQARDYPVVQGAVLAIATATVLVNLATDIVHIVVDPRSRDAEQE